LSDKSIHKNNESLNMTSKLEELRRQFPLESKPVEIGPWQFEIFRHASPDDLISEEDFDRDGRLPYWADFWPSTLAMSKRIAEERGKGWRLLDLGCGLGLASVVAVRAGFDCLATDYYSEALSFTEMNARHNNLRPPATRLVDWRDFPSDLGRFDLVVASDVLFERPNVPLVAAAFARTLGPAGRGWVTDPGRPPAAAFPEECQRHGLRIVERAQISVTNPYKPNPPQTIEFYELVAASAP
jgi:predicted nicotinamide N-methyase